MKSGVCRFTGVIYFMSLIQFAENFVGVYDNIHEVSVMFICLLNQLGEIRKYDFHASKERNFKPINSIFEEMKCCDEKFLFCDMVFMIQEQHVKITGLLLL